MIADAPVKLWLVDAAALMPIRGETYEIDAAFVIYPSALLDALIALFELEWERGVRSGPSRRDRRQPSPRALTRRSGPTGLTGKTGQT